MKNVTIRTTDPEKVVDALLLTDFDDVDDEAVRDWTDDQRADAFEWAMREHLSASDNDDVERLPCPAHVEKLREVVECPACSRAGGADWAVHHAPPVCAEKKPDVVEPTTQEWVGPQTLDEARCFHEGVLSGLTIYAREKGDSTLKSKNELLRRLMDEQGWKTIETLERLTGRRV